MTGAAAGRQLACGRMLGGLLRVAGFEDVEDLVENFAVGPWSADPATCAALRRQHWGDAVGEHLGTVVARAEGSLWATPRGRDQLAVWWLLASTRARGLDRQLVALPRGGELGDPNPTAGELREAFATARRVDAQQDAEAELLWSAYCAPMPASIAAVDWSELRAFPAARGAFRGHARMLPRLRGRSGRWGLSSIDASILRGYSRDAWMMPLDWMKTGHGRAALDDIVLERGDVDVLSRLEQLGGGDDPLLDVKALRLEGRLTPDDVGWQVPAWSPDGRYLAASLYCARTRAGCVVDLHEHVIWTTPNTMWRRPEWEPR